MDSNQGYPGLGQAILLLAALLAVTMLGVVLVDAVRGGKAMGPGVEMALTVFANLLVLPLAWRRTGRPWREVFALGAFRPTLLLPLVPLTVGANILLSDADNLLRNLVPVPELFTDLARDVMRPDALSIVYVAVLGPLLEELLFRGLILHGLLQRYRSEIAIVASAALFAAFHFNPVQVVPALAVGLVYGWIRVRSGSLWLCVLAHSANNSLIWLVMAFVPFQIPGYTLPPAAPSVPVFQPLWFDLVGVLALAVGFAGMTHLFARDASR